MTEERLKRIEERWDKMEEVDNETLADFGSDAIPELLTHAFQLNEENAKLRDALGFAQSAIKSREGWSQVCEDVIGAALNNHTQGVKTAF